MRTVLLLDFDNIFFGLARLDPAAARRWARQPDVWLKALRTQFLSDGERRFLSLRCYMNPGGGFGEGSERIQFARYRPYFVAAGFEVVDCPPLTKRGKNAADIRMVIDALDALAWPTKFEEFVIASADADFTPLLQRLRAHDRRTTLVTSGDTVPALGAVADVYIDDQQLIGLLESVPGKVDAAATSQTDSVNGNDDNERFRGAVVAALAASAKPVNLSTLGSSLQKELSIDVNQNGWPGGQGFANAIRALALPGVQIDGHVVYDSARHDPPAALMGAPSTVERVSQMLGFPRLPRDTWPVVFEVLAHYARTHDEVTLTDSTKWVRDRMVERGHDVGRNAITHVVRGAIAGGLELSDRPSASEIGEVLLASSVVGRADDLGFDLSDDEVAEVRAWLGLDSLAKDEEGAAAP